MEEIPKGSIEIKNIQKISEDGMNLRLFSI
jgi:hypothetical protein